MSITIYRSSSDYSTVTNQVVLNELGHFWDTENWKNAGGQSVVKASGSDDVERLYISDKLYIDITGEGSSARIEIVHSNGVTSPLSSSVSAAFTIVKTDTALLFDVASTTFCFVVGRVTSAEGEPSYGCMWRSNTSANNDGYVFTDNASINITSSSYKINMQLMNKSEYSTQLLPICSPTCGDVFADDVLVVRMCPDGLAGKVTLDEEKYYLSHNQSYGMFALKYSE